MILRLAAWSMGIVAISCCGVKLLKEMETFGLLGAVVAPCGALGASGVAKDPERARPNRMISVICCTTAF